MSSENDENKLKNGLEEIIEIIEKTNYEQTNFIKSNEINKSNKEIMDNLTSILNNKLKSLLDSLSIKYRNYFLDLFSDYNYNYSNGKFNETIKTYIVKQLHEDIFGIINSFDAFQASFNGYLSIVKSFIEKYPKYKNKCSIYDTTLLYSSSRNNHFDLVKYLIEQGQCFINQQNRINLNELNGSSGSTALHVACFYGHLNIVKYLIDNGANYFIKNSFNETPIDNCLNNNHIKEYFETILILNYSNLTLPTSTIFDIKQVKENSIWEYKKINDNQWILFDLNQSKQLQDSFIYKSNKNYQNEFILNINNEIYSTSLIKFLSCSNKNSSINDYLWIRCRGSSIENFYFYSKWQIMFEKYLSIESSKSITIDFYSIENKSNNILLNHWFYLNDFINQSIDNSLNIRKKYLSISIPFLNNNDLFLFNLEDFSFSNNDKTIKGFLRWIPIFISENNQSIIENYQKINSNQIIIPLFVDNQKSITTINQYYVKIFFP